MSEHRACYNCNHYHREPLGEHRPRLVDNYCDIDRHDVSSEDFYFHICEKWEKKEVK